MARIAMNIQEANADYLQQMLDYLPKASYKAARLAYLNMLEDPNVSKDVVAEVGKHDRFFLLTMMLRRLDAMHPWLYERCREVEAETEDHIDLWSRAHYKAVDINEVVPTPNGFKNHGDLEPGDLVYSPSGEPIPVLARTEIFKDAQCYEVEFCDGYRIVVSGEHLWVVDIPSRIRINGTNSREKWRSIKMNTFGLKCQVECSKKTSTRPYPKIDVAKAVRGIWQELEIHPYVLGAWLGDGTNGGATITSSFDDADEMEAILSEFVDVNKKKHSNCVNLRIGTGIRGDRTSSDVANGLRKLGVYKDKHIPEKYLLADAEQRFLLLQGLMDTDGSCHKKHSQCIFVSANERLANNTFDLCQSLGFKATIAKRFGNYNGFNTFWQVQFRGFGENPPFKLKRKIKLCKNSFGNTPHRKIVSVKQVESMPVSCIQVDSIDGMYLVGRNYIPTHNSTIITFAGSFQEIIKNPEITIGIFSHSKKIASDFVFQIKQECEENENLYYYYPDIFWKNPKKESPSWSIANGLIMKRKSNPREATVEGWGLVDGQPIGKHFGLLLYDDVVTEESVNTAEMIIKTTKMWELSLSLASRPHRKWIIGTRYNYADTYGHIIRQEMAKQRIYPATEDGTLDGKLVFLTGKEWKEIRKRSDYIVACQYLQNPLAGEQQEFDPAWVRRWEIRPETLNVYILVDPAGNEKKDNNCNSAFAVIGVDAHLNKYLLDGACHKMGLAERWTMLKNLRNKWILQPGVQFVQIGYEKYGMQADIEHFQEMMKINNAHFPIEELNWPREGGHAKDTRIRRLVPDHKNWRFFYPYDGEETKLQTQAARQGRSYLIAKPIKRKNHEGRIYDLVKWFLTNEYGFFPATTLKDFLDAMARIYDMEICAPVIYEDHVLEPEYLGDY